MKTALVNDMRQGIFLAPDSRADIVPAMKQTRG
jgi:hypothetical protein